MKITKHMGNNPPRMGMGVVLMMEEAEIRRISRSWGHHEIEKNI